MAVPKFYEANLSICCVDGAIEGIISSDPKRLMKFLKDRDHEGSSISMSVRYTPVGEFEAIWDSEKVYEELASWLS